jgi:penicillin-binding protein 2
LHNPYNPLNNRPIQGRYSPGSSFKPLDGLLALQEGLITPSTTFFCPGYYMAGNLMVRCEHVDGATNLAQAIKMSCNTYFCNVFEKLMNRNGPKQTRASFLDWREKVERFGIGKLLGIDLPNERAYKLPTAERYDKEFGKNRWRSSSIISLAIGQGALDVTPLELANIECIFANRGYYYTPHLIRAIGDKKIEKPEFSERHDVGIDVRHFEPIIDGMQQVVESGTAYNARIPGIIMCGKTGTVQNPHGKNHSVFVAFAPRENPKIAIAVIVENAGYGSSYAAPIASYMIEKYLTDSISRPMAQLEYIRNMNLMPQLKGAPKPAVQKPGKDSLKRDSAKSSPLAANPSP